MPRTLQEILDHADELAARFEQMEPSGDGHADVVARLRAAVLAGADAEREIAEATSRARSQGLSWSAIGMILGTSGEAARKRYAPRPPARRR